MLKSNFLRRHLIVMAIAAVSMPAGGHAAAQDNDVAFVHGIKLKVDGKDYYLAGAPDGPDGATDIPGHYWVQVAKNRILGKHFNTGPFGAEKWWASDATDGALLYTVIGVIDTWSEVKATGFYNKGFVHYHELVAVDDGSLHPAKVVWLRHAATSWFTLDGGPHPEDAHMVFPGVDFEFIPNWMMPYDPTL